MKLRISPAAVRGERGRWTGLRPVCLVSLSGLVLTLTVVADNGVLDGSGRLLVMGLLASVGVGAAIALRARDSIRAAEEACSRLDRALGESERARNQLAAANDDLARANVELQVMHIAFADLLNLADERSSGRMRELIEDAGDELAALLEDKMEQKRLS